jgi:hypothetical protein
MEMAAAVVVVAHFCLIMALAEVEQVVMGVMAGVGDNIQVVAVMPQQDQVAVDLVVVAEKTEVLVVTVVEWGC